MWYYNSILKGKRKDNLGRHKGRQAYKQDAKKADKHIKYCKSCKRCWEVDETKSNGSYYKSKKVQHILFYEDFPLLGRKREICEKCK
mgnify:CR=1 FL=1